MAENSRAFDAFDGHSAFRVNIVQLAQIGGNLTRLLINLREICLVSESVLTNLKLDMRRITATFRASAAAPWCIIPRHRLQRSNGPVCQFPNPAVQARLPIHMIPVVLILIRSYFF